MFCLTEKQKLFVEEYLIDLNAAAAAARAGYSERSARNTGPRLLKVPEIAAEVKRAMDFRKARTEITQDIVLLELAKIAFSRYTDYTRISSRKNGQKVWNEDTQSYEAAGGDVKYVEVVPTDALSDEKKAVISGIKETKYGIAVDTYDKMKALELIGRHLGMFKDKSGLPGDEDSRQSLAQAIEEAYYKRTGGDPGNNVAEEE